MDPERFWKLAIGGLICIGLLIAFWAVILVLRRVYFRKDRAMSGPGFTLADLEEMRQKGQITEDEYRKLKNNLLRKMNVHTSAENQCP